MTSEVAIMNKLAVALAADSAVTTGAPGKEKIFTGANKIFTLSKHAPVGIMIYGHVEHFGVPWEVIIKEFRRALSDKRYATIAEYADAFKAYVAEEKIVNRHQQGLGVIMSCAGTSHDIKLHVKTLLESDRCTGKEIKQILEAMEASLEDVDVINAFKGYTYRKFVSDYGSLLNEYLEKNPFGILKIPKNCRASFKQVVFLHLISEVETKLATGIVIAGFGEDEIFPTLYQMVVDGGLSNRLRIMGEEVIDIARTKQTVHVAAFAQEEAVDAFMNGSDEVYTDYLLEMVQGFVREHSREMLDEHTQFDEPTKRTILAMIEGNLPDAEEAFREELTRYSSKKYREPIEGVLRYAPKDELAHVAESFVNLTSLRKRVSGERETVSGPIDVAVISKGDGFIWIKRKHYFESDLNHHFKRNYFN